MARLVVNPGSPTQWEIQLKPGINSIGRAFSNDIKLTDVSVSSSHCQVVVEDGQVVLKDQGSTNGTFINHAQVQQAALQAGQTVHVGRVEMLFDLAAPGSPLPAPSAPVPIPAPAGIRVAAAASPAPVAVAAPVARAAVPMPARPGVAAAAQAASAKAAQPSNYLLGSIGAVAAGFLAMMGWFLLIKATGYEIGYAAWGVGLLTGVGARVLGRSGSTALGVTAGACAFVAVLGGQFLAAKSELDKALNEEMNTAYTARMEYARDAVKAQTDDQIKDLLKKHEDNEQPTAEDLKEFRQSELPKLVAFAEGKPSRAEFEKDYNKIKDSLFIKILLLKNSVGLLTLLWLFLGVSSAYKIGSR
jgi:hypothetical protein